MRFVTNYRRYRAIFPPYNAFFCALWITPPFNRF